MSMALCISSFQEWLSGLHLVPQGGGLKMGMERIRLALDVENREVEITRKGAEALTY
jgi:hypothetical protein